MLKFLVDFFKVRRVRCADGTDRLVYRDVDSAFPLMISGWEGNIAGSLRSEVAGDTNISAAYRSKIEGLLIALDEFNNNIMADFRAAYLVFHSNPCANSEYLMRAIEKITDDRVKTVNQKMKISGLLELARARSAAADGEFTKIYLDIVGVAAPQDSLPATLERLKEATEVAQDFIGHQK